MTESAAPSIANYVSDAGHPEGGIVSIPVKTPKDKDQTPISLTEAVKQVSDFRAKHHGDQPEPEEVPAPESSEDEPVTARTASDALNKFREKRAEEKATLDRALGITTPGATGDDPAVASTEQASGVSPSSDSGQGATADPAKQAEVLAEWDKVQTRQQYDSSVAASERLAATQEVLAVQFAAEFPEIRSDADLYALASIDPDRANRAAAKINQARSLHAEFQGVNHQMEQQYGKVFGSWAALQDDALIKRVPEFKDPKVAKLVAEQAMNTLRDVGMTNDEITAAWNGRASISLRDARVQQLAVKAARYDQMMATRANLRPDVKIPPVQRPGVAQPRASSSVDEDVKKSFDRKPTLKTAAALLTAQRRAAGA